MNVFFLSQKLFGNNFELESTQRESQTNFLPKNKTQSLQKKF